MSALVPCPCLDGVAVVDGKVDADRDCDACGGSGLADACACGAALVTFEERSLKLCNSCFNRADHDGCGSCTCECHTDVEIPGPHIASCKWADPNYVPPPEPRVSDTIPCAPPEGCEVAS